MNMNRFAALAALLTFTGLALWSPSISAAYNTADAVDINVTGLIYADPCTVTVPDTISLGQYARADIAVAGGNTATIPFNIKMTNCPVTTTKATILFNGVPYPGPIYASAIYANSAANPAQDLGLQLFNLDGKSLVNLANNVTYTVDVNSNTHEANLPVAAMMYTPHGKVTAGDFSSVVTITIAWQ
ncbi:fimbrial protein SthD [Salmonella enterica]|uniref:fimbrial protein n=1 Tax=Salmonella enterica TaxID=28901 RepID=UPI000A3A22A7|nr:fimbrial protein [Salmonella enterica]EDQ4866713.1 fimbrial protein SthD [Salmonella enterica subsp. enterica serovar Aqua]EAB3866391.1 fimbrial protein SthD [Salmonella enterica]EAM7267303.1 fimbrial protein SthD [Salmonella enterica]EAN2984473.1 fimbrial protein SthD [Salmonella enterica]EAN6350178.1 fimbrial protein SthD [Salmonella enterica]